GNCIQELLLVRRCSGCFSTMVVWTQRCCLLSNHALPGADVLLPSKGCKPAGLLLSTLHHPLLVAHLHIHMGGTTPLAVYVASRLGAVARNGVLHNADCSFMGRDA